MRRFSKKIKGILDKMECIVAAEIGIARGAHAKLILDALPNISKIYLIDPFKNYNNLVVNDYE